MAERVLTLWVIYENPADYPGKFVVRPQWVYSDARIVIAPEPTSVVDTLELARWHVPPETVWQRRHPDDDPAIVEVWF